MYLGVILVIVVAIGALLAYSASKPNTFRLERSATIEATPGRIFELLNDFRQWPLWSPWEKLDADLKRSYSGAASGVGAVYEWEGHKAGTGRMEILEADPGAKVLIQLDFVKPMPANNKAEFTLTPAGDGTRVVWAMYGPQPFMNKLMTNFISIDKMVGGQFEEGLANLAAQAKT